MLVVFLSIEQPSKQVVRPVKGAITEYKFGDASGYGFVCVTILDPKVANLSGRIEGKSNCVLLTTV